MNLFRSAGLCKYGAGKFIAEAHKSSWLCGEHHCRIAHYLGWMDSCSLSRSTRLVVPKYSIVSDVVSGSWIRNEAREMEAHGHGLEPVGERSGASTGTAFWSRHGHRPDRGAASGAIRHRSRRIGVRGTGRAPWADGPRS